MNVLSNYAANNRYQPQTMYRFTSAGFNNVVVFKAAPTSFFAVFSRNCFSKLLDEGVPCAYTNVSLIPSEQIAILQKIRTELPKLKIALPFELNFDYLKKYKEKFFVSDNKIFNILESEVEKHPECNLEEIIDILYPKAYTKFTKYNVKILTDALLIANHLPKKDFDNVKQIILGKYSSLFNGDNIIPINMINKIQQLNIEDKSTINLIIKEISKLHDFYDSPEGFIVKNRFSNNKSFGIITELLSTMKSSIEHICPQSVQKKAKNKFQVVILTTEAINNKRANMSLDDFAKYSGVPIRKNLQKHINRLIEIQKKWKDAKDKDNSARLANYILLLKYELEKNIKRLKINVDELRNTIGQEDFDKRTEKVKDWLDIK